MRRRRRLLARPSESTTSVSLTGLKCWHDCVSTIRIITSRLARRSNAQKKSPRNIFIRAFASLQGPKGTASCDDRLLTQAQLSSRHQTWALQPPLVEHVSLAVASAQAGRPISLELRSAMTACRVVPKARCGSTASVTLPNRPLPAPLPKRAPGRPTLFRLSRTEVDTQRTCSVVHAAVVFSASAAALVARWRTAVACALPVEADCLRRSRLRSPAAAVPTTIATGGVTFASAPASSRSEVVFAGNAKVNHTLAALRFIF